jgi:hypothetical protein
MAIAAGVTTADGAQALAKDLGMAPAPCSRYNSTSGIDPMATQAPHRRKLLTVRATDAEREQLRQAAAMRGTTVAGLIRQSLAAAGVHLNPEVQPH